MAGPIVNVNVVADTKKFSSAMKSAGDDTNFLTDGVKKIGIAAGIALAAAAAGAVAFGAASLKAAAESEAITKTMANAVKNAGAFGETAADIDKVTGALDKHSTKLAELTGIDDELFNKIKTGWLSTPDLVAGGTDAINRLAEVTADVAAGTGKDIESIALTFQKVAGDEETAMSKLQRAGIVLTDSQKETYQSLLDTSGEAAAQTYLIEELGKKYEGAAAAAANPFSRLKVIFDNLKETVGRALLPVVEKIVPLFAQFVDNLTASPEFQKFLDGIGVLFGELLDALMPLMPIFMDIITALLPPMGELFKALGLALADILPALMPLIEKFPEWIDAIIPLIDPLTQIVVELLPPLLELFGEIVDLIIGNPDFMDNAVKGFEDLQKIIGPVASILEAISNFLDGIGGKTKALDGLEARGLMGRKAASIGVGTASPYLNYSGNWGVPQLAEGGIIKPRPGGTLANIAEAGKAEAVIPLDKLGAMGGVNINIQGNVGWSPEDLANIVSRKQRQAMALSGLNGIIGVR